MPKDTSVWKGAENLIFLLCPVHIGKFGMTWVQCVEFFLSWLANRADVQVCDIHGMLILEHRH